MEGNQETGIQGITPNSIHRVFEKISQQPKNIQFLVQLSAYEIYNEKIRDLFCKESKYGLAVKEHKTKGFYIESISSKILRNDPQSIKTILKTVQKNRKVGKTKMNQKSSRSHCVFAITIEASNVDGKGKIKKGTLNLVDLAGSERQKKSHSKGQRFLEATKINLSLSALGNVINALATGRQRHVPYRDSLLTKLLRESLGGNSRTLMIATISPGGKRNIKIKKKGFFQFSSYFGLNPKFEIIPKNSNSDFYSIR
eukprot:Anaeramoba_ignava/a3359_14.p1 GENE.a3359_14~~a3359_14.p1  ORF type:complete len:255 (-),score=90.83 a3359_14:663-1427(-)